jgi:hypothetical protein
MAKTSDETELFDAASLYALAVLYDEIRKSALAEEANPSAAQSNVHDVYEDEEDEEDEEEELEEEEDDDEDGEDNSSAESEEQSDQEMASSSMSADAHDVSPSHGST